MSNPYEEAVKDVLSGKTDTLELDCYDDALDVPSNRFNDEVEENIRCVLEDAGLWDEDFLVSVNSLANGVSCDDETKQCMISQDFTIYIDNGWEDLADGTAITTYYYHDNGDYVDVSTTTIVMDRHNVERLYNYIRRKKMLKSKQ